MLSFLLSYLTTHFLGGGTSRKSGPEVWDSYVCSSIIFPLSSWKFQKSMGLGYLLPGVCPFPSQTPTPAPQSLTSLHHQFGTGVTVPLNASCTDYLQDAETRISGSSEPLSWRISALLRLKWDGRGDLQMPRSDCFPVTHSMDHTAFKVSLNC